jgi:NAD(P)H-hydrate epimerase
MIQDFLPARTFSETAAHEDRLFEGRPDLEWQAIQAAAEAVTRELVRDFTEQGPWPENPDILIAAGPGHNGADALLVGSQLLGCFPKARIRVWMPLGTGRLKDATRRALQLLASKAGDALGFAADEPDALVADVLIDGIHGSGGRLPLSRPVSDCVVRLRKGTFRLRAAIDVPTGLGEAGDSDPLQADVTYATGCPKTVHFDERALPAIGRLRVVTPQLFENAPCPGDSRPCVALRSIVAPLGRLRPNGLRKQNAGKVLIVAGSAQYPGAGLLAALGALHAGAGLVTAAVPEAFQPGFAARAPEAIWRGLPQQDSGDLALEALGLLVPEVEKAQVVVLGPGIGRSPETAALMKELAQRTCGVLILDADALQPAIVEGAGRRRAATLLTPHPGEWRRLQQQMPDAVRTEGGLRGAASCFMLVKGYPMRLCRDGARPIHFLEGGPVLARGGHGDILAGLLAAVLTSEVFNGNPADLDSIERAISAGCVWAGLAAEALARAHGQRSAIATALLDHLPQVLREA